MSNIEKLLEGVEVEWKTLREVCENVSSGKNKEKLLNGKYPVFGSTGIIAYTDAYKYNFEQILVARVGANAGYVHKANGYYDVSDNTIIINVKPNFVLQYLFYLLQKMNLNTLTKGGGQPLITAGELKKLLIPIPCPNNSEKSLEIQQEIVRVLDKFSELTAELQARKSQYEYYRNQLLTYPMEESDQPSLRSSRSATSIQKGDNPTQPLSTPNPHIGNSVLQPRGKKVEWKTLGEVVLPTSNIKWKNTNKSYRYIDLTSVCRNNNIIIETIEINKENAPSRAQKLVLRNDVIFATTRPTQQRLCLIPEEYDGEVASTGYCVLRANIDLVLPKWIYFWITSNKFKNYVEENQSGSAYPAISDAKVKEFKIPIPYPNDIKKSLEEQEHIIAILDKFETLTASITEGLPKEIELRQKQYEYYRDMLLTFSTDNIKA